MSYGEPFRKDGQWMVPATLVVEGEDIIGDGYTPLTPEHPRYQEWVDYIGQMWAGDLADRAAG